VLIPIACSNDGSYPTFLLTLCISNALYEYVISKVVILRDISTGEDKKLRRISVESPAIKPVAVRHQHRHLEYEIHQRVGLSGNSCYFYSDGTRGRISARKRVSPLRVFVVLLSPSRHMSRMLPSALFSSSLVILPFEST
jgi:hypothetical protein